MPPFFLLIIFINLMATPSSFASCDVAFDQAVTNGPLEETELTQSLECKTDPIGPKRKPIIHSLCVFSGVAKESEWENLGKNTVSVVHGGDTEAESLFPELIGVWYNHKLISKEPTPSSSTIFVKESNLGVKISRNVTKEFGVNRLEVEKIFVSNLDKKLLYEKLHPLGNSRQLKLIKSYSLDCSKFAPKNPNDETGEGGKGKPPPGSSIYKTRTDKSHKAYQKPNSGISAGSENTPK